MKRKHRKTLARNRGKPKSDAPKQRARSKYARKRAWLNAAGLFGFQVPEPKPY